MANVEAQGVLANLLANFQDEGSPPEQPEGPLARFLAWCEGGAIEPEAWSRACAALDRELRIGLDGLPPEMEEARKLLTVWRDELRELTPDTFPVAEWRTELARLRDLLQFRCPHCGEPCQEHLSSCPHCQAALADAEEQSWAEAPGLPPEYVELQGMLAHADSDWPALANRLTELVQRYRQSLPRLDAPVGEAMRAAAEACEAMLAYPRSRDEKVLQRGWQALMGALAEAIEAGSGKEGS